MDQIKSQICKNIGMYARKHNEVFGKYSQRFAEIVQKLLHNTGTQAKYDSVSK